MVQFKTSTFDWFQIAYLASFGVKALHIDPTTDPFIITAQYDTTPALPTLTLNVAGMGAFLSRTELQITVSPTLNSLIFGGYQLWGDCATNFTIALDPNNTPGLFIISATPASNISWALCDRLRIVFNIPVTTVFPENGLITVSFPTISTLAPQTIKPQFLAQADPQPRVTIPPISDAPTPSQLTTPLSRYTTNVGTLQLTLPQRLVDKAKAIQLYSRSVTPYVDAFIYNQWYPTEETAANDAIAYNLNRVNFGGLYSDTPLNQWQNVQLSGKAGTFINAMNAFVFVSGLNPHRTTNTSGLYVHPSQ
eukprot:UN03286